LALECFQGQMAVCSPDVQREEVIMPTIMVIDDDANIRAVLKYRFEKERYTVHLARNGLEAVKGVNGQPPDLIILDILMPKMDGISFLEQLRGNPRTRSIPVIVLTALGRGPQWQRTQHLGVEDWVVKPFSPRRLVERVREVLNSG